MKVLGSILVFYGLYSLWSALQGFLLGLFLAIPLLGVGGWMLNRARTREQEGFDADAALVASVARSTGTAGDPPVLAAIPAKSVFLYLRPFDSTNAFRVNPHRIQIFSTDPLEATGFDDIERYVAKALRPLGAFVALGMPGEHWGAGRLAVDEAVWKDEVLGLARLATVIVLLPSYRPGTLWEIGKIQEHGYIEKTIFLMPPLDDYTYRAQGVNVGEEWKKTQEACLALGLSLPDASFGGALFRYVRGELVLKQPMPHNSSRYWRKDLRALCPELARAVMFGSNKSIEMDQKLVQRDGLTPLMQAAGAGDINRVRELVAQGTNVNSVSNIGSTALMYAAKNAHEDVVLVLLDAGADRSARTHKGNSASDLAEKAGHKRLAQSLVDGYSDLVTPNPLAQPDSLRQAP